MRTSTTDLVLRRLASCGWLALCLGPSPLAAQYYEPLAPGTRVRVSHTDRCCRSPVVGPLASISGDSLVIDEGGPGGARVALHRGHVHRLATRHDIGSRVGLGAVVGLLAGAAGGVLYMLTFDCEGDDICGSFKPLFAVYTGGIGGAAGLLVGAAIGAQVRHVVWRTVPVPSRVGIAPNGSGGAALALAFRF